MLRDNQKFLQFMLGAAIFAALGTGVAGVYLARQAAELARSSDDLLQEVKSLRANLTNQDAVPAADLAVAPAHRSADDAGSAAFIAALREVLNPIAKQIAELDASMRRQTAVRPGEAPMPPTAIPPSFAKAGSGPRGVGPAAALDALPKETRARVDEIFQRHAEDVRSRIAAETNPDQPDPEVLMRVMNQSRSDLASELSGVIPPEEYEAMFPSMPGRGPAPGVGSATTGKSQSFK